MENQVLTPHVYWAQRHRELYLRVELSDVQNPAISITENVLHFKAQGHGAKGDNVYEFHLEFLDLVKPEPVYKLTQRQVNITVQKKVSQWWERLTKQEKRPLFLAPDFDRWLDESDAEMELRAKEEERLNKLRLESQGSPESKLPLPLRQLPVNCDRVGGMDECEMDECETAVALILCRIRLLLIDHRKPDYLSINQLSMQSIYGAAQIALTSLKKGYLFMYNFVQFLGFSWIFVNMTVRFFILGKGKYRISKPVFSVHFMPFIVLSHLLLPMALRNRQTGYSVHLTESFYDTFHTMADMMYFCQMLSAVETINAAIGVTQSPVTPSLIQLLGRNFILFIIFGTVEEMQNKAVVFFVFYIWSTVEIFRYPFYMLSCIDMNWKVLTWLRYTVWIPAYPLGCLAEAVSVIQSIPVFNETGRFSFTLPYPVKIKVRFSFFLQIYLIILFLGLYVNIRHLYKQRRRHFGQKKKKIH
ncbi:Very-long-chain -3-hydroxyacyl-CoA dehydratase 3 [Camelus dromedarius]|uniref:Very-long-chain (3R)-3-hydroxyacyl-CoA dehydratase n=1 Tax=Camelus dromedarius TaxID=9838 RepID=A0A5N4E0S6_CAMDR|nr:Very-long-chain -3-hydroxyacyl-CoA dehydratase 3 [Camelus dromedarius]